MALRKERESCNKLLRNYMENANIRRLLKSYIVRNTEKQKDGWESRIKGGLK